MSTVKTISEQIDNEQKIIYLMLRHKHVIEELADSGIYSNVFNDCHKVIVQEIFEEFETSNRKRLLTREVFKDKIQKSKHVKDLLTQLKIYDTCFMSVAKDDELTSFKNKLNEGYISRNVSKTIEKFQKDVQEKGWIYATANLQDSLSTIKIGEEVHNVVFDSIKNLKNDYIQNIIHEKENPAEVVTCNIPEIDDAVGGFKAQHLTLIVSDTGVGKTNVMLNICLNISDQGHPVLFVPLEMPWQDLMRRIVANRFEIPVIKLLKPQLLSDEEIEKLKSAKLWDNDKFHILDSYDRFSLPLLKRELEKRIMIFKPKMVAIDYMDILKSENDFNTRTEEIGEMVHSIRTMGKKYGFHILSAAQMNRAGIKALKEGKEPDSTVSQGSHSYSTAADTMFVLAKVPDEPDKIKLNTIKARHTGKVGVNELRVDPGKFLVSSTHWAAMISADTDLDLELNVSKDEILGETDNEVNKKQDWNVNLEEL